MRKRLAVLALVGLSLGVVACEEDGGVEESPATTGDPGDPLATEPAAPEGGMDPGDVEDPALEDPALEEGLDGGTMEDGTMLEDEG